MASTPHPHPPGHELPPRDAAFLDSPAPSVSSDPDRTSTSDSSFSALGEVLSSTVGVAPKHLPRFGVGERNRAHQNDALEDADVARDDPTPSASAPPSLQPQEGETLHPTPPRPIPCEAFEINMDILREIIAEQRAAQPVTSTIPHVARASSTTLPSITESKDGAPPAHAEPQHPERPASALSITSAKSGALGSTPRLRESAAADAQVEAWSAGVADAARPPSPGPLAQTDELAGGSQRESASPPAKGVVEPLHGGFYLAEPSPAAAGGTPVSPTGERALPRLSHSDVEGDAPSESTVEAEERGDIDGPKRVSLATRLRGEAKVLAGKLKNDDAKVAEGRALKSGEAP